MTRAHRRQAIVLRARLVRRAIVDLRARQFELGIWHLEITER